MWKGEDGMDALPLLKTTTIMKKGMGRRGDAFKVKDKVRPAPLVLTLTDEQAALAAPESNQLLHLQLGKRYYAERLILCGWSRCYVRVLFFLPFFLPAFTLTLTAFLRKEELLTHFLF